MSKINDKYPDKWVDELGEVQETYKHQDHGVPMTRREAVSRGFASGSAIVAVPSVVEMILRTTPALAEQQCPGEDSGGSAQQSALGVLVIDCAGGISTSGNVRPSGNETSYDPVQATRLGQNAQSQLNVDTRFGMGFFTGDGTQDRNDIRRSQIFQAMSDPNILSPAAQANVRVGAIGTQTPNDTSTLSSPIQMIWAAGNVGSQVASPTGTRNNSDSGSRQRAVYQNIGTPALRVTRPEDAEGAVAGKAIANLNLEQRKKILDKVKNLSESQAKAMAKLCNRDQLKHLTGCAQTSNRKSADITPTLDPRQDADAVEVYQLNNNNAVNGQSFQRRLRDSTIALGAILGNTGGGAIEIPGCDYHGRQTRPDKDFEVGVTIALALELAHRKQQPLYMPIISDGSIAYQTNSPQPRSDSRAASLSLAITYNPSGPLTQRRVQLGPFTANQAANPDHLVGSPSQRLAIAHYVNWEYLRNPQGFDTRARRIVQARDFDLARLGELLMWG